MAHEKLRPNYFFDEEKIAQLKQLAPECFEDGKINFETLKQNLGDFSQNEEDPELEHFGLFWPGKRDARKAAALPPEGTLEPVWGDGLKADGTADTEGENDSKNIFIEGENLEVLKLLQKSYANKIKMIYIDPPYNTGNDFVYDDDFTEPLQEYLRRTGQVDEEGKALTTNKRSDGRFHSKWLSMMYPRLRLARNLLRDDGVIFISIGPLEVANLTLLGNEIFGEENKVGMFSRLSKTGGNKGKFYSPNTEFILIYAKNAEIAEGFRAEMSEDLIKKVYTKKQVGGKRDGEKYRAMGLYQSSLDPMRGCVNQRYYIKAPDGTLIIPPGDVFPKEKNEGCKIAPSSGNDGVWRWTYPKYQEEFANGNVEFNESNNNVLLDSDGNFSKWNVNTKIWLNDRMEDGQLPGDFIDKFESRHSSKELQELNIPFDFAKPTELISYLIKIVGVKKGEIILDFFAGSASTAHAILMLNKTEKIERNYICVQIPELTEEKSDAYNAGFKTISSISKERIRRVAEVIKKGNANALNDFGFRSVTLAFSNYKPWKNYQGTSIADLETKLALFNESPLRDDYTKDGLLTEIILLEGFTLCSTISKLNEIKTNAIKKITSEYCEHSLLVCLDDKIEKETIANIQLGDDDVFICLDSAISTEDKLRLSDKGLIRTI